MSTARFSLWAAIVIATMFVMPSDADESNAREAEVQGVTVKVTTYYTASDHLGLAVVFHSSDAQRYNVYCVSAYYDLQYELRDEQGRIIPVNSDPSHWHGDIQTGNEEGPFDAPDLSIPEARDPCRRIKVADAYRGVLLSDFYPDLPEGKYTLVIRVAPRGLSEGETLAPMTLILGTDATRSSGP